MSAHRFTLLDGRAEASIAKREAIREAEAEQAAYARAISRAHENGYQRAVRAYRWMAGYALVIGLCAGVLIGGAL